jgi:hypothetical protein
MSWRGIEQRGLRERTGRDAWPQDVRTDDARTHDAATRMRSHRVDREGLPGTSRRDLSHGTSWFAGSDMLRYALDSLRHRTCRAPRDAFHALEEPRKDHGAVRGRERSQLPGFTTRESQLASHLLGAHALAGLEPPLPPRDRVDGGLAEARIEVRCLLGPSPTWPVHRLDFIPRAASPAGSYLDNGRPHLPKMVVSFRGGG